MKILRAIRVKLCVQRLATLLIALGLLSVAGGTTQAQIRSVVRKRQIQVKPTKKPSRNTPPRKAKKKRVLDASTAPLRGFTPGERELLAPHLEQGPVVFAMFNRGTVRHPAVVIATYVDAPAADVARIIAEPRDYPEFMPALDAVNIEKEDHQQKAYSWTWQLAVFTLSGRSVMTVFPEPKNDYRPYRVDVRGIGGDLGIGRSVWRVYRRGERRSLLIFSSRMDPQSSNYLTAALSSGGRSVTRIMNISLSTVMVLGTKKQAEVQAGTFKSPPSTLPPLVPHRFNMKKLAPLLAQGDLAAMHLQGDQLLQVDVAARTAREVQAVRNVMMAPKEFGQSLMIGSKAETILEDKDGLVFEWKIPLPLIGVSGRMRLSPQPNSGVILASGVSGSLSSGRWGFDTHNYSWNEGALVGWGRFDPAESASLIKRLIAGNVHFSHGLAAGMQIMVVRGLRSRARKQPRYQPTPQEIAAQKKARAEAMARKKKTRKRESEARRILNVRRKRAREAQRKQRRMKLQMPGSKPTLRLPSGARIQGARPTLRRVEPTPRRVKQTDDEPHD